MIPSSVNASNLDESSDDPALSRADLLDLVQKFNALLAGGHLVPSGTVVMWSGTIATIPAGWALCDGQNGTPDLRDRFVVGARQDDAGVAKTSLTGILLRSGGAVTQATDVQGGHTHGNYTGWHALTEAQMPAHYHQIPTQRYSSAGNTASGASNDVLIVGGISGSFLGTYYPDSDGRGAGDSHRHAIPNDGGHAHNLNVVPPFFALAFIMKT